MNHNTEGQATLTRPASAVHDADASSTAQPRHREQHRQVSWLRDVILGGQDGLVNILGIVLGVIAGAAIQGSRAIAVPGPCWPVPFRMPHGYDEFSAC